MPSSRTDPETERLVVTRIAQGVRYIDISEETAVPVSTIKKIRARQADLLEAIRQQNIKKEATAVTRILQKSHKLLERRLDRTIAGKETMSDKDVVNISKEMHHQLQASEIPADATPTTNNSIASEQSKALRKAIENDDTELMVKLLFPKNDSSQTA